MRWCQDCIENTKILRPPVCSICGQPIPVDDLCNRCIASIPHYEAVRSWAEFGGPLRNALHDLKYRKNLGLGESLALHLKDLLEQNQWNVDLIAPVPLGKKRKKQRGYNQAALIAEPLALTLQLPYNPQILIRSRETQSQVDLSLAERRSNLDGAFQANNKAVSNKRILIIDDVATSGSTMDACAEALTKAGATAVFGLTVARAVLNG